MKRKALFPGTFDPYTVAHDAIVKRGLSFADEIIIAIAIHPKKKCFYSLAYRLELIKTIYADDKRISVASYDTLTVDFAKQNDVNFVLRGLRNSIDFEYENNIAVTNLKLTGLETVFLIADPEYAYISSSLVRELVIHNKNISHLLPSIK